MVLPGNNTWRVGFWGGATVDGTGVDTSAFHHIVGTFDGSNLRLYKDGSLMAGPIAARLLLQSNLGPPLVLRLAVSYFNGDIDEVRFSSTTRPADWITAEYNNQNSPGTFITMGSESCPSGTPTPTPTATPTADTYSDADSHATPTPTPTPHSNSHGNGNSDSNRDPDARSDYTWRTRLQSARFAHGGSLMDLAEFEQHRRLPQRRFYSLRFPTMVSTLITPMAAVMPPISTKYARRAPVTALIKLL